MWITTKSLECRLTPCILRRLPRNNARQSGIPWNVFWINKCILNEGKWKGSPGRAGSHVSPHLNVRGRAWAVAPIKRPDLIDQWRPKVNIYPSSSLWEAAGPIWIEQFHPWSDSLIEGWLDKLIYGCVLFQRDWHIFHQQFTHYFSIFVSFSICLSILTNVSPTISYCLSLACSLPLSTAPCSSLPLAFPPSLSISLSHHLSLYSTRCLFLLSVSLSHHSLFSLSFAFSRPPPLPPFSSPPPPLLSPHKRSVRKGLAEVTQIEKDWEWWICTVWLYRESSKSLYIYLSFPPPASHYFSLYMHMHLPVTQRRHISHSASPCNSDLGRNWFIRPP